MEDFRILYQSPSGKDDVAHESQKPDLTVVVPTCNTAPYLKASLDSIASQGNLRLEIIVADYHSTDASRDIALAFAKAHPHISFVLAEQIKRGLGAVRNYGIRIAGGTYIAFLDSDDLYAADIYREMVDFARTENCDHVMCKSIVFDHYTRISTLSYGTWAWDQIMGNSRYLVTTLRREPRILQVEVGGSVRIMRTDFMRENELYCPEAWNYEDQTVHVKSLLAAKRIGLVAGNGLLYRDARIGRLHDLRGDIMFDIMDVIRATQEAAAPYKPDTRMGAAIAYILSRALIDGGGTRTLADQRPDYFRQAIECYALFPKAWLLAAEKEYGVSLHVKLALSALRHRRVDLLVAQSVKDPNRFAILGHFLRHGQFRYIWKRRENIRLRLNGFFEIALFNVIQCLCVLAMVVPKRPAMSPPFHHYDIKKVRPDYAWEPVFNTLKTLSPVGRDAVIYDNMRIEKAVYGHFHFALDAGSVVLDVGTGSGVIPFRFAYWAGRRHQVYCVTPNDYACKQFMQVAKDHQFENIHFYATLEEAKIALAVQGKRIDFLNIEKSAFNRQDLQSLLTEHDVGVVYGSFDFYDMPALDLYRLCSKSCESFYWYHPTLNDIVAGEKWAGTEVSLITTTQADADKFEQCLASLVNQTLQSKEIIIADNGQNAATSAVAAKWQVQHPTLIRLVKINNSSVAAARNAALTAVTGRYLAIIDGNDWADPTLYEMLYEIAALKRAQIVRSSYHFAETGLKTTHENEDFALITKEYCGRWGFASRASDALKHAPVLGRYLFRSDYIASNKIAFPDMLDHYGDVYFHFASLLTASQLYILPDALYYHREKTETSANEALALSSLLKQEMRANITFAGECRLKEIQIKTYHEIIARLKGSEYRIAMDQAAKDIFANTWYVSQWQTLRSAASLPREPFYFALRLYAHYITHF